MDRNNNLFSPLPEWARLQKEVPVNPMQMMAGWGQPGYVQASAQNAYNNKYESDPQQTAMQEFLKRLQVGGSVEQNTRGAANVISGGGRVGYAFPWGDDTLTLGVSGTGYKVKVDTPNGQFRDSDLYLNGVDAAYETPNGKLGAAFNYFKGNYPGAGPAFNINYSRNF